MKEYLGVKVVHAEPCYGRDNKCVPEGSEFNGSEQEGYKVVYEDGYTSWSPKYVFEKAYQVTVEVDTTPVPEKKGSPAYQLRVVEEAKDLQLRTLKLHVYTMSVDFTMLDKKEQLLLKQQLLAMQYYFTILINRIRKFK